SDAGRSSGGCCYVSRCSGACPERTPLLRIRLIAVTRRSISAAYAARSDVALRRSTVSGPRAVAGAARASGAAGAGGASDAAGARPTGAEPQRHADADQARAAHRLALRPGRSRDLLGPGF